MLGAYILACILSFFAGLLVFWLITFRKSAKRLNRRQQIGTKATPKQPFIKRFGVMNLILVIIGISIVLFVLRMIDLFEQYGCVPDTLITCFFAVVGGECGIMGWIKTTQERNQDRKWLIEDKKMEQEENEATDDNYETEEVSNV